MSPTHARLVAESILLVAHARQTVRISRILIAESKERMKEHLAQEQAHSRRRKDVLAGRFLR